MFSLTSKLYMLVVIVILGILGYIYMVYRCLRAINVFEHEINLINSKINLLMPPDMKDLTEKIKGAHKLSLLDIIKQSEDNEAAVVVEQAQEPTPVVDSVEEDDDASVTSNEIKEILTNIQHVQEQDLEEEDVNSVLVEDVMESIPDLPEPSLPPPPQPPVEVTETTSNPYATMTVAEISGLKYEDLRNILRDLNLSSRGNKQEMAQRISDHYKEILS